MVELSITEMVFGVVTATGVIYAILQGVASSSKDRDQNFAKMLAEFDDQLKEILEKENELATRTPSQDKCDRVASDYLNILDRIAFLRELNKIDDDMIFYFDNHFAYGKTFLNWKRVIFGNDDSLRFWAHQVWWANTSFNNNRIKEYPLTYLPLDMKLLYNTKVPIGSQIPIPP